MTSLKKLNLDYKFTVRVLLHGVNDYGALHATLKDGGFKRFFKSNGKHYELLPGEYRYRSANTTREVFNEAVRIIKTLYHDDQFALTVFGREERISRGLKEVTYEFTQQ